MNRSTYILFALLSLGALTSLISTTARCMDEKLLEPFGDAPADHSLFNRLFDRITHSFKKYVDYRDPRLYALVVSLSILNIGGTYLLCKKGSTKKERLLGLSIVFSSMVSIVMSSYWLYLVDYKIHG